MTVIEIVKQLFINIPTANIVIATPSNSAANLITESLLESPEIFSKPHDIIRIVSNNLAEKEHQIPEDLLKYCATVSDRCDQGSVLENVSFVTASLLFPN